MLRYGECLETSGSHHKSGATPAVVSSGPPTGTACRCGSRRCRCSGNVGAPLSLLPEGNNGPNWSVFGSNGRIVNNFSFG